MLLFLLANYHCKLTQRSKFLKFSTFEVFYFALIDPKNNLYFILCKIFSNEFQRHDNFHKTFCGNSEFYLIIDMILLTTLHILEAIQKVQDNVTEVKDIIANEVKQDVYKSHGKQIFLFLRF